MPEQLASPRYAPLFQLSAFGRGILENYYPLHIHSRPKMTPSSLKHGRKSVALLHRGQGKLHSTSLPAVQFVLFHFISYPLWETATGYQTWFERTPRPPSASNRCLLFKSPYLSRPKRHFNFVLFMPALCSHFRGSGERVSARGGSSAA